MDRGRKFPRKRGTALGRQALGSGSCGPLRALPAAGPLPFPVCSGFTRALARPARHLRASLTRSTEPRTTSDTLCRSSAAVPGLLKARVNFRVSVDTGNCCCAILRPPLRAPERAVRPGRAAARCARGTGTRGPCRVLRRCSPGHALYAASRPEVSSPVPCACCGAWVRSGRSCAQRPPRLPHAPDLPARSPPRGGASGGAGRGALQGGAGGRGGASGQDRTLESSDTSAPGGADPTSRASSRGSPETAEAPRSREGAGSLAQ